MQGMRDAKTIIGTTGLSENLGQNDGIRKHHWGLSMECLWYFDSCQSSVSQLPSPAGRILPYLL